MNIGHLCSFVHSLTHSQSPRNNAQVWKSSNNNNCSCMVFSCLVFLVLSLVRYLWRRCALLVICWLWCGFLESLFSKVKVLGGGFVPIFGWQLCNEHINIILTDYGPTLPSEESNHWKVDREFLVKLVVAPVATETRVSDFAATTNPKPKFLGTFSEALDQIFGYCSAP